MLTGSSNALRSQQTFKEKLEFTSDFWVYIFIFLWDLAPGTFVTATDFYVITA